MSWRFSNIPKIAHFYWGASALPLSRYLTLASFSKYNPDWELRLYRPTTTSTYGRCYAEAYTGKCYLDEAEKIAKVEYVDFGYFSDLWDVHKSDILRWHLLSTIGGIWSDMDILYVDNVSVLKTENICHGDEVDLLLCFNKSLYHHAIGFIGSARGEPTMKLLSSLSGEKFNKEEFQCVGSDLLLNNGIDYPFLLRSFPVISNISFYSLYQVNWSMVNLLHREPPVGLTSDGIVGVHWYAGSPDSIDFQNTKSIEEMASKDSFMGKCIAKYIDR